MVAVAPVDGRSLRTERVRAALATSPYGLAEHVAVLAMLLVWALPVTHGFGGRNPVPLACGLVAAIPALFVTRPWLRFPRASVLAAAVAAASVAVCLVAPTGWYGADAAAGYVYVALTSLVVASYAHSPGRRTALAIAIVLVGVEQFLQAAQAWIGGSDSAAAMVGTFYWHNPYAAFLVGPALLGVTLAAASRHRWQRVVGFIGAPPAMAGIVYSSSRATLTVLVVGVLLLAVAAVRAGRRIVVRFVAVLAVGVAVTMALPGPPLFSHWRSPTAAITTRAAAGETVAANGEYRTQFWREAVGVARAHPTTGAGYHSLGTASELTSPLPWARSPLAHDGYLQAASDGGLLLAVPFGLGCVLLGCAALRVLKSSRLRLDPEAGVVIAAAVGALALFAHSAVDFDWSYPALFVMAGLLGALAAGGSTRRSPARRPRTAARRTAATAVALLAVIAVVNAVALRAWAHTDRVAHNGVAASRQDPAALVDQSAVTFGDFRPAAAVLRQADRGRTVAPAVLRAAWLRTADAATVDPGLAALRARAQVLLGQRQDGVAALDRLLAALGPRRSGLVATDAAVTLQLAGDAERGQRLLAPVLAADLSSKGVRVWLDVAAAVRVGLLSDPATQGCVIATATRVAGPAPAGLTVPTAAALLLPADCSNRVAALAR